MLEPTATSPEWTPETPRDQQSEIASLLIQANIEYARDCNTRGWAAVGRELSQYQADAILAAGYRRAPVAAGSGAGAAKPTTDESIKRGLEDAKAGRVFDLGSFARYAGEGQSKWWIVEYEAQDQDMKQARRDAVAFRMNLIDITVGSEGWKIHGDGREFRVTAKYPVYRHPAVPVSVAWAENEQVKRARDAIEGVLSAEVFERTRHPDTRESFVPAPRMVHALDALCEAVAGSSPDTNQRSATPFDVDAELRKAEDSNRLDWIEQHGVMGLLPAHWPTGKGGIREAIDTARGKP